MKNISQLVAHVTGGGGEKPTTPPFDNLFLKFFQKMVS